MPLEGDVVYPNQLNTSWPTASDLRSEGDDHLRKIKTALVNVTANLSNVPANGAMLHQHLRVGAVVMVVPGDSFNPANYVGGTWVKMGSIAVSQTTPIARDPLATDLSGITPPNVLCLWQRTA